MKIRHFWLVLLLTLSVSNYANDTLVIGGYHYPPFMDESKHAGLYIELSQAIAQQANLNFQWKFYPYARLDYLFASGDIHIEIGSAEIWNANKPVPGLFTHAFYELEDIAVFHKSKPSRARNTQDIKGKMIGVVRGYSFPQFTQTFEKKVATRVESIHEIQLLKLLLNQRIDQVFMSKQVFLYLRQQDSTYENLDFVDTVGRYQVAIRVHPSKADIIPKLNTAIQQLQQSGLINHLFSEKLK